MISDYSCSHIPKPLPILIVLFFPQLCFAQMFGTHFFYWYDCPKHDCKQERMPYHPPGMDEPYRGTYYSSQSTKWYEQQVDDLEAAGFDYIFPVSWGERHQPPHFKQTVLKRLVRVLEKKRSRLRIGLYDDTQSQPMEWNADHGRGKVNSTDNDELKMSLANPEALKYFYDYKIKPFFEMIPRKMWATHNGRSVARGGRPLILTFTIYYYKDQDHAHVLWRRIKQAFEKDFGVEPWILPDWSWWHFDPKLADVADGKCVFGAAGPAGTQTYETPNGYIVSNLGPGRDDRKIGSDLYHPRWSDGDGNDTGQENQWLRDNFAKIPPNAHLVVLESWNELFEGSALCRCVDYPKRDGGTLPDDYYIQSIHSLIEERRENPARRQEGRE
jgi:hypothetical protein